jgi:signal transduction histidine kinase/ligand-binding sensor domain-containing protein/CheY-like chemotaxis protein
VRIIAGLLALVVSAGDLRAQRFSFKNYGQDSGLASLDVQSLLQDRTGFLWVGTANGLYRYDGRHFRMYTTADGLPAMQIPALAETADGTLWVGTMYGLARRTGDRFEKVATSAFKSVREIVTGSPDKLIIATESGLVFGNPSAQSTGGWDFRPAAEAGKMAVYGLTADATGAIWYGCGKSICVFDAGHNTSLASWGLPPEEYTGIVRDRQGNLWARGLTQLVELPKGSRRFVIQGANLAPALRRGRLDLDRAGDLLVPTVRGLACRTPDGVWRTIDRSNGLPGSSVTATLEDREGSLWIGVTGNGLVRWLGRRRWAGWTEAEGLSHDIIWGVRRDHAGTLWAATESGLNRFDPKRRRWVAWPDAPLRRGRILALAASPDGKLWVGRNPGGLVELDPRTGHIVMHGAATGLDAAAVMSLDVDHEGHIWVGTRDAGLFEGVTTAAGTRFHRVWLLPHDPVSFTPAVHCDRFGRIWVATWYGVFVRQPTGWRQFTRQDGLRRNTVTYLGEGGDGAMWLAYREPSGVSRLWVGNDGVELKHFSRSTGMRSDQVIFIGADTAGRMWMGTGNGLDSFDGNAWTHYDSSDGLIWNDCDSNAFYADPDGSVWIGTSRGLSHFYGADAPARPTAVSAVLTSARFGETPVSLTGEATVPYSQRAFHATFAPLTFINEESAHIRYRLVGLDTSWTETDDDDARYSGLRPGDYTFEAEARVGSGNWSAPTQFSFRIEPPWWLRWWALWTELAACYMLGRQIWAWRMRSILKRQKALERAVEERTRELMLEQKRVLEQKRRAEQRREVVEKQKLEIERLLRESQESARLKSEFLANISHEIRTPMNGIIGMTDLLFRTDLAPDQAECLRLVKLSADSLLSVINDVLDFSKIEAGKLDLDEVEFSPAELLRDTVKAMEVLARTKRLALSAHIEDASPARLVGDPGRLRQVLVNLIGNAIKFTERGGIDVEMAMTKTAPDEGGAVELRISVRDSGIGIPDEKQKLIFEPFRQADGSTSRRYGGTGLGLAICARLVEMMGGRIWLESRAGAGSTFWFTAKLQQPRHTQASSTRDAVEPAAHPARPLRVLVAEDNPVNQKLAVRLLQNAGHTVVCARDGQEAVETITKERFDIVLMDVQMPRMDGFEATGEIRKLEAALRLHTPIVALTANAMKGDRERCLEAGMDGYVSKPLRPDELLALMSELAGGTKSQP